MLLILVLIVILTASLPLAMGERKPLHRGARRYGTTGKVGRHVAGPKAPRFEIEADEVVW